MTARAVLRFAIGTLCLTAGARLASANLASPYPVQVQQPDGQAVTLYVRGNEKVHWYEFVPEAASLTRDAFQDARNRELARTPGFTVLKDPDGRYVYATVNDQGEWAPTDRVVGRDEPATQQRRLMPPREGVERLMISRLPETGFPPRSAAPLGEVKNLVVLIRFSNHASRQLPSQEDFNTLFNATNGHPTLAPTGSVQDFYRENSYGKLTLNSTVLAWVTLPKSEAFYANGKSGLDTRVREAMVDALNLIAQQNLVNFEDFDNENGGVGDGWIDAITFVHSGYGAEWGGVAGGADYKDRIWSHRWVINTWTDPDSQVKVRDYNINPGLWGTSGNAIGRIGVICHELGHFFGLPDLYDYSGTGEGCGSWCLMANSWGFNGSQLNPPHMSAWSKVFLGWNTPVVISSPGNYSVPATALPDATIYRLNYNGGGLDEYLLVENRQPVGNFEAGIPSGTGGRGGLAIWHIDDAKTENDTPGHPDQAGWPGNGNHYWVGLLQADGKYDLEKGMNRGEADDVYREGHKTSISPTTIPSSNGYTGLAGVTITNISASQDTMTFQLGSEGPPITETNPVLAGFVRTEVPTSHSSDFSDDGKAATLVFDRLYSSVAKGDEADLVTATFVLPVKSGSGTAELFLQGFVFAEPEVSATLMVTVNGKSEIVDLEAAREPSRTIEDLHEPAKATLKRLQPAGGLEEGFSWIKKVEATIPPDSNLTATIVVLTNRSKGKEGQAHLVVDSLDVTVKP